MVALAYQRSSERFGIEAPVTIEDFLTKFYFNGTIYNYSADGVYLETDYALRPGRKTCLKIAGELKIFNAGLYLAEIRWRRPLIDQSSQYSFGMGMKYC